MLRVIISFFLAFFSWLVNAEEVVKHPRAVEILEELRESMHKKDGLMEFDDYLAEDHRILREILNGTSQGNRMQWKLNRLEILSDLLPSCSNYCKTKAMDGQCQEHCRTPGCLFDMVDCSYPSCDEMDCPTNGTGPVECHVYCLSGRRNLNADEQQYVLVSFPRMHPSTLLEIFEESEYRIQRESREYGRNTVAMLTGIRGTNHTAIWGHENGTMKLVRAKNAIPEYSHRSLATHTVALFRVYSSVPLHVHHPDLSIIERLGTTAQLGRAVPMILTREQYQVFDVNAIWLQRAILREKRLRELNILDADAIDESEESYQSFPSLLRIV